MKNRRVHTRIENRRFNFTVLRKYRLLVALALLFFIYPATNAQDEPLYDEISVYVKLPYAGMGETDALIRGGDVYLSVPGFFDFLSIRNVPNENNDIISGFFINPEATYTIDRPGNQIIYEGRTWPLGEGDLVRSESGLYLKLPWYGRVFGLDCRFSIRELTVTVETKQELPRIREMKLAEMRAGMTRLKGEIQVDTTVGRSYPGFRFGMADWSVYAIEQPGARSQARLNLSLGSVIAGGEATASLNYYTGDPFLEKQQYYLWRHVNNDRTFLRQVMAGKITTNATASIYDPVIGVQLTNTPTTFRRSFGTYILTDNTEPGWTVELYVNNVLVDYVKADASGFFTFEVPLVYGNTMVKLKYYGPWGEERTREQNLTIPYNFIPHRELEYTVSAGVVEDSVWSRFSRAAINYGATRFLTLGGGAEYLSSVSATPVMPFVNASLRLPGNVLLSGEYTHGVRARGRLSYRFPSNIQMDLDYIRYDRDQRAISFNYLEERRAALSIPFRIKKFTAYSRLSYYQIVLPAANYSTAEWLLAGSILGVNTNLTTYGIFAGENDPSIYSMLSLAIRLPGEFLIMPQAQFNYTDREFVTSKLGLEKRVFERGYVNLSWERNFRHNITMGEIGIRYDFAFAQTGLSARQTNRESTFVQYARGSLINDRPTGWLKADNRTNVGRGGISVIAFLDFNVNGTRDAGEPKVSRLNVRSSSGTLEHNDRDSTIHITGLEPYVKYYLEIDESSFENISWRLEKKSYAVVADPNMLKLIEIPVFVRGEATGTVKVEEKGIRRGIGRIIVSFHNSSGAVAGRSLTEEDGYFSYFGLAPGLYQVRVDSSQLRRLGLVSEPDSIVFSIMSNSEGDYIENLDFTLRKPDIATEMVIMPDSAAVTDIRTLPGIPAAKDTSYLVIHEVTRELVTITEDYYAVQFGAFRNRIYAEIMKNKVEGALDKNVELFEEDGFWKVRITGFSDRGDLEKYIPVIHDQGITEIWVISNRAVKGEWITTTKEDSLAVVSETITEEPMPVVIAGTTVQLGAFGTLEETVTMSDRLLAAAEKLVTIRNEGGLFKVQISGFADTSEVREFIPLLRKYGFENITVLHESETGLATVVPPVPAPVVEIPAEEKVIEPVQDVQPEIIPDQPVIFEEVAPTPPPAPRFVLHAGSYYRLREAERAKQRIERRISMPVQILEEWGTWRVVITGFYTREETYPYYPELAGLGFTDIFVYEKPLTER
ncbi:MAG: SPOR domain-containing protein [Bacteroidales bacterium]|jgi:cell division protein FtsN|nr:SPOR domain-containing protein [Bacteroidales bacterium]